MSWLWIIPVLGILVVIHELGHFVSARVLGIRVEEFGIGFPPRIFAIRHNNIDYSLNALPIGGFVRIVGENGDSTELDSFAVAPAWKRIIVLAAGSFMNLALALLLFIGLGFGGEQVPDHPQVGFAAINAGSPAAGAQLQPGDLLLAVDGTPTGTTQDAQDALNSHLGQQVTLQLQRNGQTLTVPVTLRSSTPALGVYLADAVAPVRVATVDANSAAAKSGLQPGDVITAINGQPASSTLAISMDLAAIKQGTATITVTRNGAPVQLSAPVDNGGVSGWSYRVPTHLVTYSPQESIGRGFSRTGDVLRRIPEGIATAISGLFNGTSQGPALTGIVGIAQLTGEVANQEGISGLVQLTALLGINLFLLNMLPFPALDGGRLLFVLIELLRGGRKIAPEKEGLVHLVGMSVLLLLMAVVTFFDVQHLLSGGSLLPP